MSHRIQQFHLFNQMAGPLFRELAVAISEAAPSGATLYTGHPDTLAFGPNMSRLRIEKMPVYNRASKWSRVLSWLNYTLRAFFIMARMPKDSAALIVSNPPILGPAAWLCRVLFRRKYFVLIYDLHPDVAVGMNVLSERNPLTSLWRWANRRVWNRAEGVITIGARMAARLAEQFTPANTTVGRVEVVPIWVDTQVLKPLPRAANRFAGELQIGERTVVLYSGNMGHSHDIDSILAAAKRLSKRQDIVFVLIGEGAKWQAAVDFSQNENLDNLMVLPFQPEAILPYSLAMADIALVSLDAGAEGMMIPSKTYYYMAAGAAVLAISQGQSELTDTLKRADCGGRVAPGQPKALANKIEAMADDSERLTTQKDNARRYCVAHHDLQKCTSQFVEILKNCEREND